MQQFPNDLLDEIRKKLEEEKTNISARIHELTAQDPFADPDRGIDNSAETDATEESDHDRVAALVEESQKRLAAVNQALSQVADGTYGFCTQCKQMIDTDRLAILPTASLCLTCSRKKKS